MCLNLVSGSAHLGLFGVILDVFVGVKGAVLHDDSQIVGHERPVGVGNCLRFRVGLERGFVRDVRHVHIISRVLVLFRAGRGFATLVLIIAVVVLIHHFETQDLVRVVGPVVHG